MKDLKEKLSSEKILGESGEKTVVTTTTTTSTAGSTDTSNKKGIKRKSPVRSNLSNSKESSLGNSKKNSNGKEVETGSSSPQTKEEISKDSVGKLLKEITSTLEAAESFLELMNTSTNFTIQLFSDHYFRSKTFLLYPKTGLASSPSRHYRLYKKFYQLRVVITFYNSKCSL